MLDQITHCGLSLFLFFIIYFYFEWRISTPILHANVGLGPYITVTHAIPRFGKESINSHYFYVEKLDQNCNFECIFLFFLFFKYPLWLLEVVESRKLWFWVAGKDYFSHFNLKVFLPLHASSAFVLLCFFHFL
jgi:hypothetical protein